MVGQEITFDASSSADSDGEIASFVWDFGNNNSASTTQATTTHSYSTSTNFIVSLQVIDNEGATSSLATSTVSIREPEPGSEEPLLTVVINEIAWMGTATSSWDEWIELYNNTTSTIDLAGWKIEKGGEVFITISTSTAVTTTISNFYLLERAEKATNITADFVYGGERMSNAGEKLELRNASSTLIDVVDCSSEWFAGKASPNYISMERINSTTTGATSTNWADNNLITKNGLDADNNQISGTPKEKNSVSYSSTEISGTVDYPVLTYLGSPYIVSNTLIVPYGETLTIEPEVTLEFDDDAGLEVEGTLKAIGEENEEIIFTSSSLNYWQGIYFNSSSTDSELNWVKVKYGRWKPQLGNPPAILVENSSISFRNSTVDNYINRGIKLINSSSSIENVRFLGQGVETSVAGIEIKTGGNPTIKDSYFEKNKHGILVNSLTTGSLPTIEGNNFKENETPIYAIYPNIIFKDNQGENNQNNGILLFHNISQDLTWFKNDLPYVVGQPISGTTVSVDFGKTLTVEPGVEIEFGNGGELEIYGTLSAQGTAAEPIIFTAYPFQAPWQWIHFTSSSTDSILENVLVSYGGYSPLGSKGSIYVEESSIEVSNSTSSNSFEAGIYLVNSSSTVENSHFLNNKIGIEIQGTERLPQLTSNQFSNNEKADIYWPNGGENCEAFKTDPALEVECNCCPY